MTDAHGTISLESAEGLFSGFGQNDDAYEAQLKQDVSNTEVKMRAAMAKAAEEAALKAAKEAEEAALKAAKEAEEAEAERARADAEAEASQKAIEEALKKELEAALAEAKAAREALEEAKASATVDGPTLMEMAVVVGAQLGIPTHPVVDLVRQASEKLGLDNTVGTIKDRLTACYGRVIAEGYVMAIPSGYAYGVALEELPTAMAIPMCEAIPFTAVPGVTTFEALPTATPIASPQIGEAIPMGQALFPDVKA